MSKYNLHDELGQFTAIPEAVIEMIPEIGSDAALLYLYFRYRTNRRRGAAWPGYNRMSKDLNWGRQKISNTIKTLEDAQLIERKKRYGQSTIYTLKKPQDVGDTLEETPTSTEIVLMKEDENSQKYENATPLVRKSHSSSTKTVLKPDVLNQTQINQNKDSRSNDRKRSPRQLMQTRLMEYFSEISGHAIPEPETKAERSSFGTKWSAPIWKIMKKAADNESKARTLIYLSHEKLSSNGMTMKGPISLIGTIDSIIAESNIGKGELRPKQIHEMSDTEFIAHLDRKR